MMKGRFWTIFFMAGALHGTIGKAGTDPALTRFEVIPSFAPVSEYSPNFSSYAANAIAYLRGMGSATDARTTPSDYQLSPTTETKQRIDPREAMITGGFNSWRGFASPTAGWEGNFNQFALEQGNRIHFGLAIETVSAVKISLDDISFQRYWLDGDDLTASDVIENPTMSGSVATPANPNYSPTRVGLLYGTDGLLGGDDDVLITSGPGSQLVDAIYYIGVGDAFVAKHPEAGSGQLDIDMTLSDIQFNGLTNNPDQVLGVTYKLMLDGREVTETSSVTFSVPEPSAFAVAAMVVVAFSVSARRRFVTCR